jgi:nitronate monooxygenase
MRDLKQILDIKYPIISAPMGAIAGAKLANSVSKAGGLGLIGGGYCDKDWIKKELEQSIPGEFGIGFVTWCLEQRPEVLSLALEYKPKAIMLSFGDITPFVDIIKDAGIPLICQVHSIEQAIEVKNQGADIIVAQGCEAGGHGCNQPLLSILSDIINSIPDTPIVAAGGISDGNDVKKMLSLGAQGVLMGTRFYASEEAGGTSAQKQRIISASSEETVRTRVYDYARGYDWPQPYTGRALKNSFYEKWHQQQDTMLNKITTSEKATYTKAALDNDFDVAGIFVGEGVDRIDQILSVEDIIKNICFQAKI